MGAQALGCAQVQKEKTMTLIDSLQHWFAAYAQGASGSAS
jgi:hypothetical protein